MARFIPLIAILLLALGFQQQSVEGIPILAAYKAYGYAKKMYDFAKFVHERLKIPGEKVESLSKEQAATFDKFHEISVDIQNLKEHLDDKLSELPTRLSDRTKELFDTITSIRSKYDDYLEYAKEPGAFEQYSLDDFSKVVTTGSAVEFSDNIKKMHNILSGSPERDNILTLLARSSVTDQMCAMDQSLQQIILDYYQTVVLADLQALAVKFFAYDYIGSKLEDQSKPHFEREKQKAIKDFEQRVNRTFASTKKAALQASRELYKCDIKVPEKDKTYSKLAEVFQDYIHYEGDVQKTKANGGRKCRQKCHDFTNVFETCNSPFCNRQTDEKKCKGRVRDCKKVDDEYTLCHAEQESDRRYEWLTTSNTNMKYGENRNNTSCAKTEKLAKETGERPKNPLHYVHKCEYCVCTCESGREDVSRYFSLREVRSDTNDKKVVTGVRFHKKNNIFYVQIEQGTMQPSGIVDPESVQWKDVKESGDGSHFKFDPITMYKVDWDHKKVLLDDVKAPSGNRVVTGVRLNDVSNSLILEIETTEFDFEKGALIGDGEWQHNNVDNRKELVLSDADDPLNSKKNEIDSVSGQFVVFQTTNRKKDFGQNTIPFIDLQDVSSPKPVPLSGVGLVHKGTKGKTGGFLAFKVFQFDYASHL